MFASTTTLQPANEEEDDEEEEEASEAAAGLQALIDALLADGTPCALLCGILARIPCLPPLI